MQIRTGAVLLVLSFVFFHFALISALAFVCTHIAAGIRNILSSCFAFPFSRLVKAFLMRSGEFSAVCQTVHGSRLRHFLNTQREKEMVRNVVLVYVHTYVG